MRALINDRLDLSADPVMETGDASPGLEEKGANIRGTSYADDLYGTGGNDTIRGLGGDDYLQGNAGDDVLYGGSGSDRVYDTASGSDTLYGESGDDYLYVNRHYADAPAAPEQISMDGGDGADNLEIDANSYYTDAYAVEATLSGGGGDDVVTIDAAEHATVFGGAGNDTVNASSGADLTVSLGAGADVLHLNRVYPGQAIIVTDFQAGDAGDTLQLRNMLANQVDGWDHENPFAEGYLRLVQVGPDAVLQFDADGGGDSWADAVVFKGVAAGDLTAFNLDGFPSDGSQAPGEVFTGSDGGDELIGTNGADTIMGLGGYDWLYGNDGADSIDGGAGDDYIEGGFGTDTLIGGQGYDRIYGSGPDKIYGGADEDSIQLEFDGAQSGRAWIDGGTGDDQITVNLWSTGADGVVVNGGAGNDTINCYAEGKYALNAGSGDDHIFLDGVGDRVVLTLGPGADTVAVAGYDTAPAHVVIRDFQAGAGGDRLDLGDFMSSRFVGWDHSTNPFAAGYLRLLVHDGASTLQWSGQADGTWSDLFVLKGVQPADLVAENLSGYPGDGSAPAGMLIQGTDDYDFLQGGIGPDTIIGGRAGDDLVGGAGDDSLLGGSGNDALYGGYGADYVNGGAGNDALDATGGGNDTLIGGAGDDRFGIEGWWDTPMSAMVLSGGGGDDYVEARDYYGVVTLMVDGGTGDDSINLYEIAHSTIRGGAGADQIVLNQGDARIDMGSGDDHLSVAGLVHAEVTLGDGRDTIALDSGSSASTIEIADFSADDTLGLRDFISWNYGSDDPFADGILRLCQRGGDAVLQIRYAGSWSSLVTFDKLDASSLLARQLDGYRHGALWLLGDDGHDKLVASAEFNHLDGAGGDDVLAGGGRSDALVGGAGADHLSGGAGADVFMYQAGSDSTVAEHDVIGDLSNADTINLAGVDASAGEWGDQAFVLVDKFDGQAGELVVQYRAGPGMTYIMGDTDGDGQADFEILAKGDHHDFVNFVL